MELVSADKSLLVEIFKKPLIVGASISDDYLSISPGKRLALRWTDKSNIHVIAKNGSPGRETVKRIHEKDLKDRSVVIGMDLFFWDSTLPSPQLSLQALHKLVEMVETKKIPFILGDIPELLPGWQISRKIIQDEIHRICNYSKSCYLLPLEHLYKDVLRDGYITYQGKQHNLWELVPDGLHIGDVAGNYLADFIQSILISTGKTFLEYREAASP